MQLLYLDDSGSIKDPTQKHIILGGVCIDEKGVRWLSNEIEMIAAKILPENPSSVELHAVDIFGGKIHPWDRIVNKSERVDIIKRVLRTMMNAYDTTKVFAVAVEKSGFPLEDNMLWAYETISQCFNNHLEMDFEPQERGIIIVDDTSYETGMQKLAAEIRQTGNRKGLQNRAIIEIPLFVDSRVSRLVQLADHIAYAVFRRYNSGDLNYFNEIQDRFVIKNGIVTSLVHRSVTGKNCLCPACLSRNQRK